MEAEGNQDSQLTGKSGRDWGGLPVVLSFLISCLVNFGFIPVVSAEDLIQFGSTMKYLANYSDPGIGLTWKNEIFSDGSWPTGTYGVGYETRSTSGAGALLQTTVFPGASSLYTRASFNIADVNTVSNLFLGVDYDDGYIAWINGVEVYRSTEMPAGAPDWNTNAGDHESSNGSSPDYNPLHNITSAVGSALHNDTNILAIGVWNIGDTSSDLVLVPKLSINEGIRVTRGPYLQRGSQREITVRWRTDLPTNSRVSYGTTIGSLSTHVDDSDLTTEHRVVLTELSSDTQYYYSIGTTTETLAGDDGDHFFLTSPQPGTDKPTRVWILGDSGTANANAEAVRDRYVEFTGSTHTDLWLMLGDNAYPDGSDSEYQAAVFDMYPDMLKKAVLWPTLGNHDAYTGTSGNHPYYDIFSLPRNAEAGGLASGTEAYYSFDYGKIHFVCLDSHETDRSTPEPFPSSPLDPGEPGAMMTWLQYDLADTTQDWIIAFWHHPPYSKGSHDSDSLSDSGGRMVDMRENALPILEDYGVDLVLAGHSHNYERSYLINGHYGFSDTFDDTGPDSMLVDGGDGRPTGDGAYEKSIHNNYGGAVYTVAGSSGSAGANESFPPYHPVMAVSYNLLGSIVLDINNDQLDARFIDDTGAELDNFTIIKHSCVPTASDDLTCDGIDDDCDGAVDEDWTPGTTCGVGACLASEACNGAGGVSCTPGTPSAENTILACTDRIDNDCDGDTDLTDVDCQAVCVANGSPNSDGDEIIDSCDNCTFVPNDDQLDSNGDGYGNMCDPDLDNDNIVGILDFNIFRNTWLRTTGDPSYNPDVDLDGDGVVGILDFNIFRNYWLKEPGPAGPVP